METANERTVGSYRAMDRRRELLAGYRGLNREVSEPMKAFGELHRAAMADGVLSSAHKELIALAIGVAKHCDDCITLHTHDALRAGASREEVGEAIGVAVLMGGGPASTAATTALAALDQFEAARA